MKLGTLRGRLLRTLTLALLVVFGALWLLLVLGIQRVSERQLMLHLEDDEQAMMAAVQFDAAGHPRLDMRAIEPAYAEAGSGHYYQVRMDGADFARSPSLAGEGLATDTPAAGMRSEFHVQGPAGQQLAVLAHSAMAGGRLVTVYVADDMGDIRREMRRLGGLALLLFVVVLPGALVLQGIAVRRALQPLDALQQQLREVGAGRHAHIEGDVPLEIKPLVDELNRLLALLHRRLNQSRTALGNLAHSLKTPLALLVRTADDPSLPEAARASLQEQALAIRERLERELRRARLAGPAAPGAGALFNPRTELAMLVRVLHGIYSQRPVRIDVDAADELLPFDREDMLELVGNLADNACKWAASRLVIDMNRVADAVRIVVADDGPGCSEEDAAAILERGMRLDARTAGHGLGLAIVKEIVDLYGGTIAISRDAALRGMRVEVALPLPATPGSPAA